MLNAAAAMWGTVKQVHEVCIPAAPNSCIFDLLAALKSCTSSGKVEKGMALHAAAVDRGVGCNLFVSSTLVRMYAKCGFMIHSQRVFDSMPEHNVVSWTALILGYAENGEGALAIEMYVRMHAMGCKPNDRTFVAALKACTNLANDEEASVMEGRPVKVLSLAKGMVLHSQAACYGCDLDLYVSGILIDMYAKCGIVAQARKVFDTLSAVDVVSWTALILGYAEHGEEEIALKLFACMPFQPDAFAYVAALVACSNLAARSGDDLKAWSLENGMAIHCRSWKSGCGCNVFLVNTLIDMYGKCGRTCYGRRVFDGMGQLRTVVGWNALILGYTDNGEADMALEMFDKMQAEGYAPDFRTFTGALKACMNLAAREESRKVDGKLVRVKALERARQIHAQATSLQCDSHYRVACILVDVYGKCGSLADARDVFERTGYRDAVSWTTLLFAYVDNGEGRLALEVFERMKAEGCIPTAPSYVAALKACGMVGALDHGRRVHADVHRSCLDADVNVASSLVDFYCKCGSMVDAQQVFDSLDKSSINLVTWTALMTGYSHHGDTDQVFELFERMRDQGLRPNEITFLCLLNACCHAGLVQKGREYFKDMVPKYNLHPQLEHYTCMVDMLGRAGELDEAVDMLKKMPLKADAIIWETVLSACKKWKNLEVGKLAFQSLISLDKMHSGTYVLMSSIYGSFGTFEEQSNLFNTGKHLV